MNNNIDNPRTVYILGAGFSKFADYPVQNQFLGKILEENRYNKQPEIDYNDNRTDEDTYRKKFEKLLEFVNLVFPSGNSTPLEDVFTLLDQTISKRGHCSGFSWKNLEDIREVLNLEILYVLHNAELKLNSPEYISISQFYKNVCAFLLHERVIGNRFSVISLNWDCLLENIIYRCIKETNGLKKADIDYCCFTNPLDPSSPHTESLHQKAKNIYNIKVLKMHGSANWLFCPNCSRLYTSVGSDSDSWTEILLSKPCRICERFTEFGSDPPKLEPFIITPTFLKVFDNAHIQMTWHNAFIELAEADEVVFIGYSLPESDYHFRTLLRSAIKPEVKKTVVLVAKDEPPRNAPKQIRGFYPLERYKSFFGEDNLDIKLEGTNSFFNEVVKIKQLKYYLRKLKETFH